MRAINTGNNFRIYDDSVQIYTQLPPQAYQVCFNPNSGFSLEKYAEIKVNEKIYGVHLSKVQKVLKSYAKFDRNLGVILSGDKGIGKSLFSKLLAIEGIKKGYPLIIVNSYIPGIANYLNSINQEVIILFDEFDKTFPGKSSPDTGGEGQTELLSLFDGIAMGKKLFVITCNSLNGLNNYLVNRPGRFHYHFRFEYPTPEEIREYMEDHLLESQYKEIDKIIGFSEKVYLNYDCLRAIAFELQNEGTFEEAIKDLNILHFTGSNYSLTIHFSNGIIAECPYCVVDMFDNKSKVYEFEDSVSKLNVLMCTFNPKDAIYDKEYGGCIVPGKSLQYVVEEILNNPKDRQSLELYNKYISAKPEYMLIKKIPSERIHYAL